MAIKINGNTVIDDSQNGTLTGTQSVTGNITGGNLITAGVVSATGNVTGNFFIGNGSLLTGVSGGTATTAQTVTTNAQPNITSVGTLTSLNVSGNANVGNLGTAGLITATGNVQGGNLRTGGVLSVTGNANIGNLGVTGVFATTLSATGNANVGNIGATNGVFTNVSGNGASLTSVPGGNVTGQVANALVAGTVYTNAQPNITSLGTLTDLNVNGNAVVGGNLFVNGNLTYLNVETLAVEDPIVQLQTRANGAALTSNTGKDVGTALNYFDTAAKTAFMGWDVSNAEIAFGANVGITNEVVTFTQLANTRSGNTLTTGVFATTLSATGNANVGNIGATNGVFTNVSGNGASLTNIPGANITGQVANSLITGTVYTNSQPNITSVGTLATLSVTGNTTSGNFVGVFANGTSNIAIPVASGNVNISVGGVADEVVITSTGANVNGTLSASGNANVANLGTAGLITATGNINSSGRMGAVGLSTSYGVTTGNAVGAFNAVMGTSTSATWLLSGTSNGVFQYGIQALDQGGVLRFYEGANFMSFASNNLSVAGTVTGSRLISTVATGTAPLVVTSTTQVANLNAATAGSATTAGTVTTNAQPNITSVGTLTSLSVSGNANVGNIGATNGVFTNVSGNGAALTNLPAGNITTGTIEDARLSSNVALLPTSQTFTGQKIFNFPILMGNANLFNINGNTPASQQNGLYVADLGATIGNTNNPTFTAAIAGQINTGRSIALSVDADGYLWGYRNHTNSGNYTWKSWVYNSVTAQVVALASQPNITSVGTLTSLSVSGNANVGNIGVGIVTATGNITAPNFFGNLVGPLANGTSNVAIPVANGNINFSVGGVANEVVITSTGANVNGTLSVEGNANVGNLGTAGLITATGNVFVGGRLSLGGASLTSVSINSSSPISGGVNAIGLQIGGSIQSDATGSPAGITSAPFVAASAFTITNLRLYNAFLNTVGTGANITTISGYSVDPSVGASANVTTAHAYRGLIASGTNRWNLFMDGTANNHLAGNLGIGTTSPTSTLTINGTLSASGNANVGNLLTSGRVGIGTSTITSSVLNITGPISGATTSSGVSLSSEVQSGVTVGARYFQTSAAVQAATFTIPTLTHYLAAQGVFGTNSTVTTQQGFFVDSSLTGGVTNYGFRGQIASGANRFNLFMDGTANNHLAGNLGIGTTSPTSTLTINGTLSASGNANVGNLGTSGNVSASFFLGNGSQLTGITATTATSLANGTSNVAIASSGANVTTSVGGTANVLVVTSTGANVTGTFSSSGNISTGNVISNSVNTLNTFGFKNRIINGDMRIDQRNNGASVTPTSGTSTYIVDRFRCFVNQASKLTAQQNQASVAAPAGFSSQVGITSSSAYTVLAGDIFTLNTQIEGNNIGDLAWGTASAKTVTLSFWVRSSLTGTFGGSLKSGTGNTSYPFTYSISSSNTWEQKTIIIPGPTTGTWTINNGATLGVFFGLGVGSTFSGTAGSWANSELYSATGATSVVGTNGATWYITGVQLEVGNMATSWDFRDFTSEFTMCQRYYQVYEGPGVSGYGTAGMTIYGTMPLNVRMRATPTATLSAFDNLNAGNATMNLTNTNFIRFQTAVTAAGLGYSFFNLALNSDYL